MTKFVYFENKNEINKELRSKIVVIKEDIQNKRELFDLYSTQLNFPEYFGKNWDALYDCMIDLSWINEDIIIIIHNDIPLENNTFEKNKYIQLLIDVLSFWDNKNNHLLKIAFPKVFESEIEND